jgi:hypothetical protein
MLLPNIEYRFLNWRDGMKITQKHLVEHDNAIRASMQDIAAIFINNHNYGLLPAEDGVSSSLQISLMGDTIELSACRAITPGGVRVEWQTSANHAPITLSVLDYKRKLGSAGIFFVILKANPFKPVEVGEYDTQESPMRRPYLITKPELDLLSSHDALSDVFSIPIFKIRFEGQLFSPDYEYIPPSVSVHGENLKWYYDTCGRLCNNIQQTSVQIVRKIGGMQNRSQVAVDIHRVLEKLLTCCVEMNDYYRIVAKDQPPIYFTECLIRFARVFRVALDCLPDANAARLYNYLKNNVGGTTELNNTIQAATKSFIDGKIDNVLISNYNHNDSMLLFDNIVRFLDFLDFLLQKLSPLNYVDDAKGWDIA